MQVCLAGLWLRKRCALVCDRGQIGVGILQEGKPAQDEHARPSSSIQSVSSVLPSPRTSFGLPISLPNHPNIILPHDEDAIDTESNPLTNNARGMTTFHILTPPHRASRLFVLAYHASRYRRTASDTESLTRMYLALTLTCRPCFIKPRHPPTGETQDSRLQIVHNPHAASRIPLLRVRRIPPPQNDH
ncbi:hypothetical protein C8J57DRAFT_1574495 [Mycena rebaudengoi]|nr:hypothetical protein C8J57DRAFT_1574495 [Mycena rebaudengoi]